MEAHFGYDFGEVRLHTGAAAAESSAALQARAYAFGTHIVFGAGEYAPDTAAGRHLLAHELAHVVQQRGEAAPDAGPGRRPRSAMPSTASSAESPAAGAGNGPAPALRTAPRVQRQFITPLAQGGGYQGLMERDRRRSLPPPVPPQVAPLRFYHGTRWSVAQNIGRIEPRGIGDFGRGFYTHFEPGNDAQALDRAKRRGMWAARQNPAEPYAGVLGFEVNAQAFADLLRRRSRIFPLNSTTQPDYATRQREWLDYVTTHGREQNPRFFMDSHNVERWRHHELPDPAVPPQAITTGPFYVPRPGLPGPPPPREDFQPYAIDPAQPTRLQQQVVWANEGLDLLNRSTRQTLQFDATTGDPIDPPIPASVSPPQQSMLQTPQNPEVELRGGP